MKLEDSSWESGSSGGGSAREEAFGERYRKVALQAGVEEGLSVRYRRHVEGFIRCIKAFPEELAVGASVSASTWNRAGEFRVARGEMRVADSKITTRNSKLVCRIVD
jgi:hypothetical protein